MVHTTKFLIISALALFAEAKEWNRDFVRDVVVASTNAARRLEAHEGGDAPQMDLAACAGKCPDFMKFVTEVAMKMTGEDGKPLEGDAMDAAMKEHACPKISMLDCPLKECDAVVKATFAAIPCACKCPGLLKMSTIDEADIKDNCKLILDAFTCIQTDKLCDLYSDLYSAEAADATKKVEAACPKDAAAAKKDASADAAAAKKDGGSSSSFATPRALASAGLSAILAAKTLAEL